jgi:hypothetical protein
MKVENLDAVRDSRTNAIVFEKKPRPTTRKDKYIKALEKRMLRLEARLRMLEEKL